MNHVFIYSRMMLLAFVLFIGAGSVQKSFASGSLPPPLNPKTYYSPSGHFALHVDPSQRQGKGPADYRLLMDGQEVWSGERPFTFRNACVLDDGTVKGYVYSLYIVNGVFAASWQREEVIEAAIIEVDGEPAVWTLNKTFACGALLPCSPQFPVNGEYWVALIIDGDNPGSGEDYILSIVGIQDETEAKSMYDDYLATGDTSGLSPMDIANCNVEIK